MVLNMRRDGTYPHQARVLRALAHPIRLQIAEILSREEACICHLEAALGLRQAYISQQVGVLRGAGLLAERREGVFVYLRLANPHIERLLRSSRRVVGEAGGSSLRRSPARCACPRCRSGRGGKARNGIPRAGPPGSRTKPRG
jgi:ArsR family transcriptional regulator